MQILEAITIELAYGDSAQITGPTRLLLMTARETIRAHANAVRLRAAPDLDPASPELIPGATEGLTT